MKTRLWRLSAWLVIGSLSLAGCRSLIPPETCGPGSEGEADEAAFARDFRGATLINAETGLPPEGEEEAAPAFLETEELVLQVFARYPVAARACVQERTREGHVAAERIGNLVQGANYIPLGSFAPGSYVVRLIVSNVLMRNLTFEVTESAE